MNRTSSTQYRPTFDALEDRCLMDAGLRAGLPSLPARESQVRARLGGPGFCYDDVMRSGTVFAQTALEVSWSAAPQQVVIRNARDLVRAFGQPGKANDPATQERVLRQAARMLGVRSIDFENRILVLVSAGTQRSGGYSVEPIGRVREVCSRQTIHWQFRTPPPGAVTTTQITHPARLALIDRAVRQVELNRGPDVVAG